MRAPRLTLASIPVAVGILSLLGGCGDDARYSAVVRTVEVSGALSYACGARISTPVDCVASIACADLTIAAPGCIYLTCQAGRSLVVDFGVNDRVEYIMPGDAIPELGEVRLFGLEDSCPCAYELSGRWTVLEQRGAGLPEPPYATPDFYMKLQFETLPSPPDAPCPYEGSMKAIIEYTWEKYSD